MKQCEIIAALDTMTVPTLREIARTINVYRMHKIKGGVLRYWTHEEQIKEIRRELGRQWQFWSRSGMGEQSQIDRVEDIIKRAGSGRWCEHSTGPPTPEPNDDTSHLLPQ